MVRKRDRMDNSTASKTTKKKLPNHTITKKFKNAKKAKNQRQPNEIGDNIKVL